MKTQIIFASLFGLSGLCSLQAQNASEWNNNAPINGVNSSGFGFQALGSNAPTDANNTALGWLALFSNNGGSDNTAAGSAAMNKNTSGSFNSAFGTNALYSNLTGISNTAHGHSALFSNDVGSHNTAVGDSTLFSNTSGYHNTAVGYSCLFSNNTGILNTALGDNALFGNTIGTENIAIGISPLYNNLDGSQNIAIGEQALYNNISGSNNVAIGLTALVTNTTGNENVAIGFEALFNNTSGFGNIAMGTDALYTNSTGAYNCAYGYNAMQASTSSSYNIAVGTNAMLFFNGPRNFNIAIGTEALFHVGVDHNIGIGDSALYTDDAGKRNTAVGDLGLFSNKNGNNNSAFGYAANTSTTNLSNATAIGNGAVVNASNKIRFGNSSVTVVEGPVAYTISDGRFKTNIKEDDVKGLEFIKKLRPVVYNFDTKKFTQFLTQNMDDKARAQYLNEDFKSSTDIRQSGFIAQEVEQAAEAVGYDFNGVHKPNDDNDNYSLAYSQFVVPLVKAVQEQQQMIDDLKSQLAALSQASSANTNSTAINTAAPATGLSANSSPVTGFSMDQNVPNPFTHETVINYTLPQNVSSAYLAVYDLNGKQLSTFPVTQKGSAQLSITAGQLAAGIYLYSIIADGAVMGTKRMVIADK